MRRSSKIMEYQFELMKFVICTQEPSRFAFIMLKQTLSWGCHQHQTAERGLYLYNKISKLGNMRTILIDNHFKTILETLCKTDQYLTYVLISSLTAQKSYRINKRPRNCLNLVIFSQCISNVDRLLHITHFKTDIKINNEAQ